MSLTMKEDRFDSYAFTNAEGRAAVKPGKQAQSHVEITGETDGAKAARPVRDPELKRQRKRPYSVNGVEIDGNQPVSTANRREVVSVPRSGHELAPTRRE